MCFLTTALVQWLKPSILRSGSEQKWHTTYLKCQSGPMYALGHSLQTHSTPVRTNVRYASDSDQIADELGCRLSANSRHRDFLCHLVVSNLPVRVAGVVQ